MRACHTMQQIPLSAAKNAKTQSDTILPTTVTWAGAWYTFIACSANSCQVLWQLLRGGHDVGNIPVRAYLSRHPDRARLYILQERHLDRLLAQFLDATSADFIRLLGACHRQCQLLRTHQPCCHDRWLGNTRGWSSLA